MDKWNVGIFIFDGVEVLDFAGPFEVFSRTRLMPGAESRRSEESAPFRVFTVAKSHAPITTTGGLTVIPHHGFADAPKIDLLVVPGGWGTRPLFNDPETLDWIRRTASGARQVTSVCTGSLLLAKAGLLTGRRATHTGTRSTSLRGSMSERSNRNFAWSMTESSHRRASPPASTRHFTWSSGSMAPGLQMRRPTTSSIGGPQAHCSRLRTLLSVRRS